MKQGTKRYKAWCYSCDQHIKEGGKIDMGIEPIPPYQIQASCPSDSSIKKTFIPTSSRNPL